MDYALSRLQARFGERPDESLWQKLEGARDPAAALEIAQSCGLRRWVPGIAPYTDSHKLELALRAHWRECVTEIATWMPRRWQSALLWTRALADLPALLYLAHGGVPLGWMSDDPVLKMYARADSTTRQARLRQDHFASMGLSSEVLDHTVLQATPGPSHIGQAWLEEWRRRWPRWIDTTSLENLASVFNNAMKERAAVVRPELLRRLRVLFRSSTLDAAHVFIYIAFAALDIERLRAGLMKHALAHEGVISP